MRHRSLGFAVVLAVSSCSKQSGPTEIPALILADMQVSPSTLALHVGESAALKATLPDAPNAAPIAWASSDTLVAVVQPGGIVVGRRPGMTNITASFGIFAGAAQVTVSP